MEIGFGVAGTGMIARVHADAIQTIPGARLVAVCGPNADRTQQFAARYGAEGYTDYHAFLSRTDLNVVNICTPSGTHAAMGILAAAAGKHLLVEKPIEITLERAHHLIEACDANHVKLGVIFQSRFLPAVRRLKEAVDQSRFGRLILGDAYVKWYRAPDYYSPGSWHGTLALDGGGALINQAIHTVDLLRWLMGPVETVFAFKTALRYPHIEGEDTLVASLRFVSGALGVIEAATSIAPGFKRRLEISGERGTVVLDGDDITTWAEEGLDQEPGTRSGQLTDGSSNPATISVQGHQRQIEEMMLAIAEDREPAVSGREALKSLELVEALYRSARESRPITL